LLSGAGRAFVAVVAVGMTVLAAWLGTVDYHLPWANDFDLRTEYRLTHAFRHYEHLLRLIADLGNLGSIVVVVIVFGVLTLRWRRRRATVLVVVSPLVAVGFTEYVAKPWVHRAPFGVDTYPSGHSTSVFAVATAIAIVLLGASAPPVSAATRWGWALGSLAIAAVVAVDVVAAGYHFATDAIGGSAIGIAVPCVLALGMDLAGAVGVRRR
jgi:membrane-associated phospholipid phosphatase